METYYCLDIKGKKQFQTFSLYTYCRNTYLNGESTHENVQSCLSNENRELLKILRAVYQLFQTHT